MHNTYRQLWLLLSGCLGCRFFRVAERRDMKFSDNSGLFFAALFEFIEYYEFLLIFWLRCEFIANFWRKNSVFVLFAVSDEASGRIMIRFLDAFLRLSIIFAPCERIYDKIKYIFQILIKNSRFCAYFPEMIRVCLLCWSTFQTFLRGADCFCCCREIRGVRYCACPGAHLNDLCDNYCRI